MTRLLSRKTLLACCIRCSTCNVAVSFQSSGRRVLPTHGDGNLIRRTFGRHVTTGKGIKTTFAMRIMQALSRSRLISEKKKLELFPPFWTMGIRVLQLDHTWRHVRILLPLNNMSRNPGGVMFGGFQASLADPIAAMSCANVFPKYSCWTRGMTIDFQRGGSTDLELRFEFDQAKEAEIRKELEERGRATPTFEYGFYLTDGTLATRVTNTVAIRPKGYIKATTPPVARDEFSSPEHEDNAGPEGQAGSRA